jgi:diguanylate cyclase (GGDEF)-like protein
MRNKVSFSNQYRYLFVIILLPILLVGFYSYQNEKNNLINSSFTYLEHISNSKEELLKRLFENHKQSLDNLGRVVKVLRKEHVNYITNIQYTKIEQISRYIENVKQSLNILSKKEEILTLMSRLGHGKNVHRFASQYLPFLKSEVQVDQIYLINKKGVILASSDSSITSEISIQSLTSTLKKSWQTIHTPTFKGDVIFADFAKKSTNGEFAAFGMIRLFNDEYIAISLSRSSINAIMQFRSNALVSVESYLIGYDNNHSYLVNDCIVKKNQHLGDFKISKEIEIAKKGIHGITTKLDETNTYELATFAPLSFSGLFWSIHTTMSYEEALTPSIDGKSIMNDFMNNFGFYDLFFVDKFGTVFFSIKHESDYMSNIHHGPLSHSHFSKIIRKTMKTETLQMSQFEPYAPSSGKKAAFVALPILDTNADVELVLALQIPFEPMIDIMAIGQSQGFKIHSFLIGNDYKILVDSQNNIVHHNENQNFLNTMKKLIQDHTKKSIVSMHGTKESVLSIVRPIHTEQFEWHLITQMPYQEISKHLFWIKVRITISLLTVILITLFFLWRFAKTNKSHATQLENLAYNDPLTKLPNRRYFSNYLTHTLEQSKRKHTGLAILFIDLDHFKYINDSYGHDSGDNVLVEAAKRLEVCTRKEDFVARIGGDEFILLLNGVKNILDIEIVAQKIIHSLSQPIKDKLNHIYHIGCSIGISLYPDDASTTQDLITYADTAMFKAKQSGRNQHTFYKATITQQAKEKITLLNDLSQAIEQKEFLLHYQPQIDPITGNVVAAEALVRWQHPKKGLLYPDSFIMMAEESLKIIALGEIVLKKACEDFLIFRKNGIKMSHIAVNISAKQLFNKHFVSETLKLLESLNFEPQWLELEITETSMVDNIEKAITIIAELSSHGVRFSIDDFGTGFSSLEYLKRLHVNTIKIDRAFIMDLPDDKEDVAIVNAVIYMAHEFNFEVVAEGVEDKAQLHFLMRAKVPIIMQGYYYSKPIDLETFITNYA